MGGRQLPSRFFIAANFWRGFNRCHVSEARQVWRCLRMPGSQSRSDGEVIAEAGQSLSDALMKKIRKAEINKVKVFVTSGRAESTMIKNTLAKDPTARYYKKENGEQRSPQTGSKSTRCPSISASTLEWPIQVSRSQADAISNSDFRLFASLMLEAITRHSAALAR